MEDHNGVASTGEATQTSIRTAPQRKPRSDSPRRTGADLYDTILWRMLPTEENQLANGFAAGFTSCMSRSGVSTVAANVAIRAADHNLGPVLLLDANPARARLHRAFRLRSAPGIAEVLSGDSDLSEAICPTGVEKLSVIQAGSRAMAERLSVDQHAVDALMTELRDQFSIILVDLPDCRHLRHALFIARRLDAVLMVLRSESVTQKSAKRGLRQLTQDGVSVSGSILTQQRNYVPRWLHHWL